MSLPLDQYFDGFPLSGMVGLGREFADQDLLPPTVLRPEHCWVALLWRADPSLPGLRPPCAERVVVPAVVIAELRREYGTGEILRFDDTSAQGVWSQAEDKINAAAQRAAARFV